MVPQCENQFKINYYAATVQAGLLYLSSQYSRRQAKLYGRTSRYFSFLGSTEVEQPKGTEVVRDAVRKLKFARHIKKSEGQKTPKVELQISIYGVKILDPKTKEVQHNCQLHRISFCADDKTDKRIFTFICKDSESNKHLCYVFDSEKCVSMQDALKEFGQIACPINWKVTLISSSCQYSVL
uniref:GULP PTB domain containing engulfment adaptor 1 n=1 Tax=Accipiter nisus TaxID=211598 RepID=A0A8B9N1A2_9AVES